MKYTGLFLTVVWAGLMLGRGVAFYTNFHDVPVTLLEDDRLEAEPARSTSSPFTETEVEELVEYHNYFRSAVKPPASNMAYISWDPFLEDMGQRWADECLWEHGTPSGVEGYYGQNLWAITETGQPSPNAVINSWVDEEYFYTYTTNSCMPGKICGHYTQIIWGPTNRIGCGRTFCPTLKGVGKNRWIVVCQYSPGGNVVGRHPYTSGPPCTQCSNGVGQCHQDLCRPCEDHDADCDCRQVCHNCGTVDKDTCTCQCALGYHGADCSEVCRNLHPSCGTSPGFPDARYCRLHPVIPQICPLMCGVCSAPLEELPCDKTTTVATTEVKTTPGENSGDYVTDELQGVTGTDYGHQIVATDTTTDTTERTVLEWTE